MLTKQTVRLTNNKSSSDHPTWFPDGKQILFTYWENGPERYRMNGDGTGRARLIENGYSIASPEGDKVSYITNKHGDYDMYIIDRDGKNQRQLTNYPGYEVAMSWSPDGKFISFLRDINKHLQVCKIGADGSGYKQLTFDFSCLNLQWNTTGGLIAYSCAADSNFVLGVMNEDGTGRGNDVAEELAVIAVKDSQFTQLTHNHYRDTYPSWSPDGKDFVPFR